MVATHYRHIVKVGAIEKMDITALCEVFYSPSHKWDLKPLPPSAIVRYVDFKDIRWLCASAKEKENEIMYACSFPDKVIAYIPTFKSYPGTKECWDELNRHELAHLKGWKHGEP